VIGSEGIGSEGIGAEVMGKQCANELMWKLAN